MARKVSRSNPKRRNSAPSYRARKKSATSARKGRAVSRSVPRQVKLVIETRQSSPISRPDLTGQMPMVETPIKKGRF